MLCFFAPAAASDLAGDDLAGGDEAVVIDASTPVLLRWLPSGPTAVPIELSDVMLLGELASHTTVGAPHAIVVREGMHCFAIRFEVLQTGLR